MAKLPMLALVCSIYIGLCLMPDFGIGAALEDAKTEANLSAEQFCNFSRDLVGKEIGRFGLSEFTIYPYLVTTVSLEEKKGKSREVLAEIRRGEMQNLPLAKSESSGTEFNGLVDKFKSHVSGISKDVGRSISLRFNEMIEEWGEEQLAENFGLTCANIRKIYAKLREEERVHAAEPIESLNCVAYRRMALMDRLCNHLIRSE